MIKSVAVVDCISYLLGVCSDSLLTYPSTFAHPPSLDVPHELPTPKSNNILFYEGAYASRGQTGLNKAVLDEVVGRGQGGNGSSVSLGIFLVAFDMNGQLIGKARKARPVSIFSTIALCDFVLFLSSRLLCCPFGYVPRWRKDAEIVARVLWVLVRRKIDGAAAAAAV
jgi:hypothetical protein